MLPMSKIINFTVNLHPVFYREFFILKCPKPQTFMKTTFTFFLLMLMGFSMAIAQEENQKPVVIKANYFDVSPPLRDMVQRTDMLIDNSWKECVVKNKLNTVSKESTSATTDNSKPDPTVQTNFGDAIADTTIQNFDGVGASGSYPPDTDGDVGPNNYFQVVNVRFAIYDKAGNKLMGPSNNSTIFNGLPHNTNDGDAVVLYDKNADRWLFSQFALPNYPNGPFYENVAISQTSDPTGSWYRYQFTFTDMPDYPKLSVWGDGYYMTVRRFSSGAGAWLGPAAVAMDRSKMLVGDVSASMVMFNLPSSSEGPLSANCDSPFPPAGTPCPVCYLTSSTVKVTDFHVDWTTPANSTFNTNATVPITMFGTFGSSNSITQKGTSVKLDGFSRKGIMFRMPFRKFSDHWSMLLNTTINNSGTAAIKWMELRNTSNTWSLYQEGTYAPGDGNHRWMGSIAMDTLGDIALGFSISSTSMFPSIRYTGRMNNDPLGQMTIAERGIINGGGSQTTSDGRWGDYSAMSPDPSELGKFWYTQEYYATTSTSNWKTRIASFSFSNVFSAVPSATPNPVCQGDSTQLNVMGYGGSGVYTYSWTSLPVGFTSNLQNPKVAPTDTTKYIAHSSDGITSRTDTVRVNVQPKAIVFAGADTAVCWYVTSIDLHGTAKYYKALGWTTTGTGTFTSTSTLNTTYNPTLADKLNGSVDVKLVGISNLPCTGNVTSTRHIVFDVCTGVNGKPSNEPAMLIQPNPAHANVSITTSGIAGTTADLTVKSLDGKIMYDTQLTLNGKPSAINLDLSGFAHGVYIVQMKAGDKVITQKLVVQ